MWCLMVCRLRLRVWVMSLLFRLLVSRVSILCLCLVRLVSRCVGLVLLLGLLGVVVGVVVGVF